MVLSPSLFFERSFKDVVDIEAQKAMFLENVPFENISSRLMTDGSESKLLATNIDFFTPIKNVFESEGFTVNLVLPYLALQNIKFDIDSVYKTKMTKEFKQKLKLLKKSNLLTEVSDPKSKKPFKNYFNKFFKVKNKRLAVLLSTFLILVLILIALLIINKIQPGPKPEKVRVLENSVPLTKSKPNNVVVATKNIDNTTIKITYNDDRLKISKVLRDQLTTTGFKNIVLENETVQNNTPKTFIVFSLKFPQDIKEIIMKEVNKTFIDVNVQENNDIQSDVLINVGESK
jgi:hypothetical protein